MPLPLYYSQFYFVFMAAFKPDPKPDYTGERLLRKSYTQRKKDEAAKRHRDFYNLVWLKNPHKCFECGTSVHEKKPMFIHHLVQKHLQDSYSCDLDQLENGVIVCWGCHTQAHTDITKVPKIQAQTFILQKKYEQFRIR